MLRRPLPFAGSTASSTRRFRRAGLGVCRRRGALDHLLARARGRRRRHLPLDQYAAGRDGIEVEFLGTPTATFRSLAILARATGAPVVPVATWRAADGCHVVRFEEALAPIASADASEWIRLNTRAYNAALERFILQHPAQWFWGHRRWKQ